MYLLAGILAISILLVVLILKTGNFVGAGLVGFYVLVMLVFSPVILGGLNGRE